MEQPKYQRVLLKLSGEALAGPAGRGIDFPFVRQVCQVVKDCVTVGSRWAWWWAAATTGVGEGRGRPDGALSR